MTIEQIKEMVNGSAYDFLRTNEHLGRKIIFLTLGGSYSYGTNVETSDVDVRGCALNSESDLLGLTSFEQVVNTQTDTTIYAFNKLVSLLLNCNPNTIEMLGCKPEHYFYISDIGREMIANRKMFLSKRAVHSFGGYANQQLRRLENALARDRLSQARREEHILNSMKGAVKSFESRYTIFENGSIVLYTDESPREDLDREIFADIQLKKYPVREFNSVINDLTNVIATIIPEMEPCIGFEQNNKYHQYTVYEHIAHAVANYKGTDVSVKVALLLHDIGKPQCYTEDENGGHFHGHGVPSRDIAEQVLDRLRFDNKTKQEVLELVLYHDTMIEPTPRTVRKWLHKLGERRFSQFLDVRMADILAHAEGTQESRIERCIVLGSIMSEVLEAEQCFALKDLQINGRDIMNLGIEQGKRVGEILNSLLDEVISGALENEHNALMQRAVELLG